MLEETTGDSTIGDRLERGAERTFSFDSNALNSDDRARLPEIGFDISSSSRVVVGSGTQVFRSPHAFVFCLTEGDASKLASEFAYDGLISISDLEVFADALFSEGTASSGLPLSELVEPPKVGKVVYGDRTVDFFKHGQPLLGPFAKPAIYESQAEWRIVFLAKDPLLHDEIFVSLQSFEVSPGR